MFDSRSERTAFFVVFALFIPWTVGADKLDAQPVSRVLVVVADDADAEWVKRIGSEHVVVELLCASQTGEVLSSYDVCNEWARSLLDFQLLIVRDNSYCPIKGFWGERLAAANPHGKVHRLSGLGLNRLAALEHRMRLASQIHAALAAVLPEQRASLDQKLGAELQRLRSLQHGSLQLSATK